MLKIAEEHREIVGKIIRDARNNKKLTLKKVEEQIGMDAGNLSRIENGKATINYDKLCQLAVLLDIPEVFTISGLPLPEYFSQQLPQQIPQSDTATKISGNDDPHKKFFELKPNTYFDEINPDIYKTILAEVGQLLSLGPSFLIINPALRELITGRLDSAVNIALRSDTNEKSVNVKLAGADKLDKMHVLQILQIIKNQAQDSAYWRGYFQGVVSSDAKLQITLENEGLYWLLAGFVSPEDALLLDTFYNAFKDNTLEEKEKLIEVFTSFLQLFEIMKKGTV